MGNHSIAKRKSLSKSMDRLLLVRAGFQLLWSLMPASMTLFAQSGTGPLPSSWSGKTNSWPIMADWKYEGEFLLGFHEDSL